MKIHPDVMAYAAEQAELMMNWANWIDHIDGPAEDVDTLIAAAEVLQTWADGPREEERRCDDYPIQHLR